jgi:hypothetical protein
MIMVPINSLELEANAARAMDLGIAMKLHAVVANGYFNKDVYKSQPSFSVADVTVAIKVFQTPSAAADIKRRCMWLSDTNDLVGGGTEGAVLVIEEYLDVGYKHHVSILHDMPWYSASGLDAILFIVHFITAIVLLGWWIIGKVSQKLLGGLFGKVKPVQSDADLQRRFKKQMAELKVDNADVSILNKNSDDNRTKND